MIYIFPITKIICRIYYLRLEWQHVVVYYTGLQGQNAVTAYFKSKKLLRFSLAVHTHSIYKCVIAYKSQSCDFGPKFHPGKRHSDYSARLIYIKINLKDQLFLIDYHHFHPNAKKYQSNKLNYGMLWNNYFVQNISTIATNIMNDIHIMVHFLFKYDKKHRLNAPSSACIFIRLGLKDGEWHSGGTHHPSVPMEHMYSGEYSVRLYFPGLVGWSLDVFVAGILTKAEG